MENTKGNCFGNGIHGRFFNWAKDKMTGEDAFGIVYGEKGKAYPEEMKKEFGALFDQAKEALCGLHDNRKAFMEKWKEYAPEEPGFPGHAHFGGGHPGGFGNEGFGGPGGFPGRRRGFFCW